MTAVRGPVASARLVSLPRSKVGRTVPVMGAGRPQFAPAGAPLRGLQPDAFLQVIGKALRFRGQSNLDAAGVARRGDLPRWPCGRASSNEVTREVCIAEAIVKTHVKHILRHPILRSRVQAVVYLTGCSGRRGAPQRRRHWHLTDASSPCSKRAGASCRQSCRPERRSRRETVQRGAFDLGRGIAVRGDA